MAAVANLRPVKDDAPPVPVRTGSASLQQLLDADMAPVLSRFREGYLKWSSGGS